MSHYIRFKPTTVFFFIFNFLNNKFFLHCFYPKNMTEHFMFKKLRSNVYISVMFLLSYNTAHGKEMNQRKSV